MASLDYLAGRGVNLVIGPMKARSYLEGPDTVYTTSDVQNMIWLDQTSQIPAGSKMIEIRVGSEYRFPALYLAPSPVIDKASQKYGWDVCPIRQPAGNVSLARPLLCHAKEALPALSPSTNGTQEG